MIRINLLGSKKKASGGGGAPFGLDEKFEKLGIRAEDFAELRPAILRLIILGAGLYAGNYVPNYLHDQELARLEGDLAQVTAKAEQLQHDLAAKKDVRKQMEQLNRDESDLNRQLNAVADLQKGRGFAFTTLNDVMVQLGKTGKVWIDDIKFERRSISLSGHSWEYFAVNDFVKAITESTRYENVLFKEIVAEGLRYKMVEGIPESTQKTKKFSLEFKVKEGQ